MSIRTRARDYAHLRPTRHNDGTVTYWSTYHQHWQDRAQDVPDRELAAMTETDRARVIAHLRRTA